MAVQVMASVNKMSKAANISHSLRLASVRKPTAKAMANTIKDESKLESVEEIAWPPRIEDEATGIVRKRLIIPF